MFLNRNKENHNVKKQPTEWENTWQPYSGYIYICLIEKIRSQIQYQESQIKMSKWQKHTLIKRR